MPSDIGRTLNGFVVSGNPENDRRIHASCSGPIDRIDWLYRIHYLQWTGNRTIDRAFPDFFNGPKHGMAIVRELHRIWPALTFDVTIKISHLLAHRALLAELASLGCAFVVSAVESLDEGVLARLDKGHTRADFEQALDLARRAGLVLVDFLAREDLIGCVDPVQLSVRLLVPPGSLLLGPDTRAAFGELDSAALSYPWEIASIAADAATDTTLDPAVVFARIRGLVHAASGRDAVQTLAGTRPPGPRPPRLSESWFC